MCGETLSKKIKGSHEKHVHYSHQFSLFC